MKLVKFQGNGPEQVEGFPGDTDRSVEGALYLYPGQSKKMTDDEYAYIQANRPDLARKMVLLRDWEPQGNGG